MLSRLAALARSLEGHPGVPLTVLPTPETLDALPPAEQLDLLRSEAAAGDRPDDVGARAAELGDRPFTYDRVAGRPGRERWS